MIEYRLGEDGKAYVRSYWLSKGGDDLGQSKARYPFSGGKSMTEKVMDMALVWKLIRCSLCGRLTKSPGYHYLESWKPARIAAHCERCAQNTDEEGRITGWWNGPWKVVPQP